MTRRYVAPDDVYGWDTETDNDGRSAWIVQWCIHDGARPVHGTDLRSFADAVRGLADRRRRIILYAHNLKYDLEFIKSFLHALECEGWRSEYLIRKGSPIKVRMSKGDRLVEFRDSSKKMPGDLRSLGKLIGLPKLDSPRPFRAGWSADLDYSEDSADWTYIDRDAEIVAVAMRQLHRGYHGVICDRATLSGDSWRTAKRMIGTSDGVERGGKDWRWSRCFPRLSADLDRALRRAYWGGINLSPMHNHGVICGEITHEDIHNSYGGVMSGIQGYDLPFDVPTIQHAFPPDGIRYIADVRIRMRIREQYRGNEWYLFKNGIDYLVEGWAYGRPVDDTAEWHELTLTDVDLTLLEDWYEVEYDELYKPTVYVFKSKVGLLKPYIDFFTAIKEHCEKSTLEYAWSKRMNNAFYGRSGLAPETADTTLEWDADLNDWAWSTQYTIADDHDAYVPYAIFCTAWARKTLLDNIRACLDAMPGSVIHCDTDSVIHYGPPVETIPHGDHLGTWGIESRPPIIIEAGFKRYIELKRLPMTCMDDLIGMALAGVPQKTDRHGIPVGMWVEVLDDPEIILSDEHTLGHETYMIRSQWLRDLYTGHGLDPDSVDTRKLIPVRVPGGVILEPRTHQLNDNLMWRLRR